MQGESGRGGESLGEAGRGREQKGEAGGEKKREGEEGRGRGWVLWVATHSLGLMHGRGKTCSRNWFAKT